MLAFLVTGVARQIVSTFSSVYTPIFLFGLVALMRPSRVFLVRSHVRSRATMEARWGYVKSAAAFGLGAVFNEIVHHLIARFLK